MLKPGDYIVPIVVEYTKSAVVYVKLHAGNRTEAERRADAAVRERCADETISDVIDWYHEGEPAGFCTMGVAEPDDYGDEDLEDEDCTVDLDLTEELTDAEHRQTEMPIEGE